MKKLFAIIFLCVFAFAVSCSMESGSEVVLLNETFENIATASQLPWTYAGGNGIAASRTGGLTYEIKSDAATKLLMELGQDNKALGLAPYDSNGLTNSARGVQLNFKAIAGGDAATLEFDWFTSTTGGVGRLTIQDSGIFGQGSTTHDTAVYANMFIVFEVNNGSLYHYLGRLKDFERIADLERLSSLNDSSGKWRQLSGAAMNRWYHVTVTVNFVDNTIAYEFLDRQDSDAVAIPLQTFNLASDVEYFPQLGSIRFFSQGGPWQPYIDNVKLIGSKSGNRNDNYYNSDIPNQPGYRGDDF